MLPVTASMSAGASLASDRKHMKPTGFSMQLAVYTEDGKQSSKQLT
jgi:hypothetical protein